MPFDREFIKPVPPGGGPAYLVVGDVVTIKLTGADTGGAYSVFEILVPPGSGSPPHVHRRESEMFVVIEGELTFDSLGAVTRGGPGAVVHLPKDVPHCFRNDSAAPVRAMMVATPAGIEGFFAKAGRPYKAGDSTLVTREAIERLMGVAAEFGIEAVEAAAPVN